MEVRIQYSDRDIEIDIAKSVEEVREWDGKITHPNRDRMLAEAVDAVRRALAPGDGVAAGRRPSAVKRLTQNQYNRLSRAAVDDEMPRTAVGEVALAIVNEYLRDERDPEGHQ